ncbi:MAG: family 1 encapsulin nanocompartment shell protein [Halanaerobiales bacterium]
MTLLKRHLAPIDDEVWEFIEDEAREVLTQKLSGRKVVDTVGPKGMDFAAYNTGRSVKLDINDEGAKYMVRNVLPLVELEVPFTIKRDEIESLLRGAKDADIDNLIQATKKVASIENNALFYGLEEAGIEGLAAVSDHVKIDISEETGLMTPITSAIQGLKRESVEGPYNFVVGPYLYSLLHKLGENGYPLKRKIKELIGGEIIFSEELGDQGFLLASRDEDFELIVGQDISIGFKRETDEEIEFFLTESFTFKVNAPEAVVVFVKP